jgi:hypothetical protein
MDPSGTRWSTLIIRVWRTEGQSGAFRARLSEVDDGGGPGHTVAVAADPVSVLDLTRDWLARWVAGDQGEDGPPPLR